MLLCYLLVAEPHLPPRISRDVHAAQKDSLLVTIVEDGGNGILWVEGPSSARIGLRRDLVCR